MIDDNTLNALSYLSGVPYTKKTQRKAKKFKITAIVNGRTMMHYHESQYSINDFELIAEEFSKRLGDQASQILIGNAVIITDIEIADDNQ